MFTEAMASVHAQTLPDSEIEIVSRCSSVWYPEKVNDLARSARGEFVLSLNDDDLLRPDCLRLMLATARERKAHVVSANVQCFSVAGPGAVVRFDGAPWTFDRFRGGPPIWITSLIDRQKFLDAGGFNYTKLQYADWSLWYELWKLGATTAHVDAVLWDYRDHATQASRLIDATACRAAFYEHYPELLPH